MRAHGARSARSFDRPGSGLFLTHSMVVGSFHIKLSGTIPRTTICYKSHNNHVELLVYFIQIEYRRIWSNFRLCRSQKPGRSWFTAVPFNVMMDLGVSSLDHGQVDLGDKFGCL